MTDKMEVLANFVEMSGLDPSTADYYLQAAGYDLSVAFSLLSEGDNPSQHQSTPSQSLSQSPSITQSFLPPPEPEIRTADPIQHDRLIGARSTQAILKEQALARVEHESVDWMFPPPNYLSNPYSLAEVRKFALERSSKRWILVNIQDHNEFSSHLLNRDVWTDETIIEHIRARLIFWQRGSTSPDGKKFISYYQLQDGELPLVGIIDPRTGSLVWIMKGLVEASDLLSKIFEFEELNSLDSTDPVVVRKAHQRAFGVKISKPEITSQKKERGSESSGNDDDEDSLALALAMEMSKQPSDANSTSSSSSIEIPNLPSPSSTFSPLLPEPSSESTSSTKISFRLVLTPSQSIRRFDLSSTVEQLYSYVFSLLPDDQLDKQFDLCIPFPRESLKSKMKMTIQEAGLAGSQVLMKWE